MGDTRDAPTATEETVAIRRWLTEPEPTAYPRGAPARTEETRAVRPRPLLPRSPVAQRSTRRLERLRRADDQRLVWRVQDVLVGRGLTQTNYSISGGHVLHVPQVVSVVAGPPVSLNVRILPGQTPDDFATHTQAIADNLGVAEVRVVSLGPSLIRWELLPGPG